MALQEWVTPGTWSASVPAGMRQTGPPPLIDAAGVGVLDLVTLAESTIGGSRFDTQCHRVPKGLSACADEEVTMNRNSDRKQSDPPVATRQESWAAPNAAKDAGRALPDGAVVQLNRYTRVWDGGSVLVGGSPTHVLRLKATAAGLFARRDLTVADPATRALAERLTAKGLADPVASSLPPIALSQLTVVIPVKDRCEPLDRLLSSIPPEVAETIVVDDGSDDPASIARIAQSHQARLLQLTPNQGPGAARNAGLASVASPFVAFVDSDVVIEPGCFEILLRHFADPLLALAAPRVLGIERERPGWITRYEDSRSSLDLGNHAGSVRPLTSLTWVSGTCMVARVELLGGGFDSAMVSGEDVDLVWRLVDQGHRVRFDPSAVVRHEHRTRLTRWMRRKFFYGTGATPLAQRHPDYIAPVVLPPWSAIVLGLVLLQRRWSLMAAAAVAAVVVARVRRQIRFTRRPTMGALTLTAQGLTATLAQGVALIVRHWWPVTLAAAFFSQRARRAAVVAGLIDAAWEYLRLRPDLDPLRFTVARRLDDVGYGSGVWWSALRGRSIRAILPLLTRASRTPGPKP